MITKNHTLLGAVAALAGAAVLTGNGLAQTTPGPQPSICSRGCWGARSSSCSTSLGSLTRGIIHHTADPNDWNTTSFESSKARVRYHQNYHMDGNGWCDIGYHFLVDKLGNIFEGRVGSMGSSSQWKRGNHAGCGNNNTMGFNFMGYFHSPYNHTPTAAQLDSQYDLIAWRMPAGWSPYGGRTSYPGSLNGSAAPIDIHSWVGASTGGGCGGTACPGSIIINNYITGDFGAGSPMRKGVANRRTPATGGGGGACSRGPGHYDVFTRGADNHLWKRTFSNGWGAWTYLGENVTADPACVSPDPNRVDVFWRGSDGACWTKTWTAAGGWTGAASLGGGMLGGPAVASRNSLNMDVFVRGTDSQLYKKTWGPTGWQTSWTPLGVTLTSDPGASSKDADSVDVFWRGSDGACWKKTWTTSGGWGVNTSIGGGITWGPDALSKDSVSVDVFVRGGDTSLYKNTWVPGGWVGWENLGGDLASSPACASWASNRVDVFVRGTDGKMYQKYWIAGNPWSGWVDLGKEF